MSLLKCGEDMKTERISIRITEKKKQKFIEMANRSSMTLSDFVVTIVNEWCDDHMTLDEVLQHYNVKDINKIKQFLMANYDQKEA